jgi:FkbM family methyltransferase
VVHKNFNLLEHISTKLWHRYPQTWKYLLNLGVLLKYKTMNPDKLPSQVVLSNGNIIHVNPGENRSKAILLRDGVTQIKVNDFWQRSVERFDPTLIIDVGVNYGECIFSANYAENARIWGIEANPYLHRYINQSLQLHTNKSQMTIVNAFASDQDAEVQSFNIDMNWSGTSSAVDLMNHNHIEHVEIPTITIDSLLRHISLDGQRLLFKIDVEGYESFVLKGMETCVTSCDQVLGIIEFDTVYLKKTGIDLNAFVTSLETYFKVYIFLNERNVKKVDHYSYDWLLQFFGTDEFHADFILTSKEHQLISLLYPTS